MPKFDVDTDTLAKLADLLSDKNLTEIELTQGDRSIRLSRAAPAAITYSAPAPAPLAAPAPASAPVAAAPAAPAVSANAVKSPMVGTVYLSPQPGAPNFVKVGDTVTEGQTLLIIEAMKVMNPIPAPRSGTIRDVLVSDAQPVEYDQPLFVLD